MNTMLKQITLLAAIVVALSACSSSEPPPAPQKQSAQPAKPKLGYTVAEFDAAIEKLYGASPEEVMSKFGKPRNSDRDSDGQIKFIYSGVEDPLTGAFSVGTYLNFKNGKLVSEKPSHSF